MSLAKAPTLFKCVKCGKDYSNNSSLRRHMEETHSDKLHECDQCEKKYKARRALLEHKRTVHEEAKQFECDKCGREYNNRSSFQSHMQTHSGKLHECDQCGKKFESRGALRYHKQSAHAEAEQYKCEQCGKIWPHKTALSNHKRQVHSGHQCECDVCGTIHRNPSSLAAHKMRAHPKATHRCEHCGKTFGLASALQRHMAVHNEEREEYPCGRCPRTFTTRSSRERHMKVEHSDIRFTCDPECGLQSATRLEYRGHLKSRHAKEHPVTCKCVSIDVVVSRTVATNLGNTALEKADETMKCADGDCDFTSTCARQMESHKEQCHLDAYQPVLRCNICGTWFANAKNLKNHNADKHQGERRYKCDKCGFITNDRGSFARHKTHCQQGKSLGNRRFKRADPTSDNLDVKKEWSHDMYRFGSKLGEGGFGKVYAAVKKGEDPPVKYAIKEVGPKGGKSAELEAKRMRQFKHKNLMALVEYYEWKEGGRLTRFIVMECCFPGSLTSMQELVQFQFEERHVLYVLKEVACGLEHLHSAGVIHRDLKSANVLVNERAEVKIADFGVSTAERIAFNCRGTPGWVAPEVVDAALTGITGLVSAYTQIADVYSVGVMAIDLFLTRETLPTDFFHRKKVESESFAETQLKRIEDDRNLQLSKAFKRLVTGCLAPMTTRLSAAAVRKVPAVKEASVEPLKELVAECLKKQQEKEEKRRSRKRKATTDTKASSPSSSTTPRSGPATKFSAATRLFSNPTDRPQQPSTSGGMSSLFSAKSASAHHGQPTASSAATTLFSDHDDAPQQPSTSGGMSSLFATASSRTDHGQLPAWRQTLRPDEY